MQKIILAFGLSLAMAGGAEAQSSSSITTHNTPLGQVTHAQQTTQVGNGTITSHAVSPGNNTSVQPFVGSTTYNPSPNNSQGQTSYTIGIAIPLGSTPTTSPSTAPAATSGGSASPQ